MLNNTALNSRFYPSAFYESVEGNGWMGLKETYGVTPISNAYQGSHMCEVHGTLEESELKQAYDYKIELI